LTNLDTLNFVPEIAVREQLLAAKLKGGTQGRSNSLYMYVVFSQTAAAATTTAATAAALEASCSFCSTPHVAQTEVHMAQSTSFSAARESALDSFIFKCVSDLEKESKIKKG